jgi:HEAT repeat protein
MPLLPPMPGFHFEFRSQASSDPEVRLQQEVFRMLLQNNPDRAVDIATERLKSNPSDPVVLANLSSLAASSSAKSQPLLISIAKTSDSPTARREAIVGIARGRGEKDAIVTTLMDVLASAKDEETQRAVTSSLAGIDTERSLRSLTSIVQDKNRSVELRRSALSSLSRNSAANLALLEELYNGSSDNSDLRRSVLSSISRRTDPRTVTVLVKVARSDPDMSIRRSAIQHLGNRKDPESIKALEELLKP